MAVALPASIQADFLVLRRAGWTALARSIVAPALLVAACVICACIVLYRGFGWCVPVSALLAAAGSYALLHGRLLAALLRSRLGWCGALPTRVHGMAWALLLLTAAALALAMLCATSCLMLAALPAPHPDALGFALLAIDGGFVVGALVAVVQVLRRGVVDKSRHAEGIREPLLALPWLHDARLPHLLDWQRRAALVKWRQGGGFALVGCVLAMVPMGAVMVMVVALVLLALSLVWFSVVMRACAAITADARRLLGAVPIDLRRMYRASLRYPRFASACAASFAVMAAALLRSFVPLAVWVAIAMAIAGAPIWSIASATKAGRRT